MDDSTDRLVEGLKIQIKKEIVDNYFADRVYLEEEAGLLRQKAEDYRQSFEALGRRFMALYEALGSEAGCSLFMDVLKLADWPFYEQYCALPEHKRRELLESCPTRGFTAYRRFRNKILDLYDLLHGDTVMLRESYDKIITHQKLLNEDIDKFNLSYDFSLIAAQMEALDGKGEAAMAGGLMSPEREELSTRMRLKRQKLDDEELPPPPDLPPLDRIRDKLISIIDRICPK